MDEQWEYDYTSHNEETKSLFQTDFKNVDIVKKAMNARGKQGWEIISVIPVIYEGTSKSFKCFWRRRLK
ncbi:MAG: DUF4177 domain-containing protein [Candidatus Omnitrophota bacterium]